MRLQVYNLCGLQVCIAAAAVISPGRRDACSYDLFIGNAGQPDFLL